jgi:hypothetical protein
MSGTQTTMITERQRVEAFAGLGFSATQSLVLAATQDAGEYVEIEQVRRLLDRGCSHDLALKIVL